MLLLQCAGVGFVTAILVNIWYVIDKFMKGNPAHTSLPLSTHGCPGNFTTTTTAATITTALPDESR